MAQSGKFWPITAGGRPIRCRMSLIDPQLTVTTGSYQEAQNLAIVLATDQYLL
jgi:hypothetical protein